MVFRYLIELGVKPSTSLVMDTFFVNILIYTVHATCFIQHFSPHYFSKINFNIIMAYKLIHYIIYYPMTTSFEYLITRSLLNTLLLSVCLESKKKIYRYIHNDSNHSFLHKYVRILNGSMIRLLNVKLIRALPFRKSTKRCYIFYLSCLWHVAECLKELTSNITCRSFL